MWSPVQATSAPPNLNKGSPVARCKHAMCVTHDGHIYLYGGRSANLPLKDLWRFDAGQNQWEEVQCRGQHPPNLQEHTMVAWNVSHDKLKPELYLFFFSSHNLLNMIYLFLPVFLSMFYLLFIFRTSYTYSAVK